MKIRFLDWDCRSSSYCPRKMVFLIFLYTFEFTAHCHLKRIARGRVNVPYTWKEPRAQTKPSDWTDLDEHNVRLFIGMRTIYLSFPMVSQIWNNFITSTMLPGSNPTVAGQIFCPNRPNPSWSFVDWVSGLHRQCKNARQNSQCFLLLR